MMLVQYYQYFNTLVALDHKNIEVRPSLKGTIMSYLYPITSKLSAFGTPAKKLEIWCEKLDVDIKSLTALERESLHKTIAGTGKALQGKELEVHTYCNHTFDLIEPELSKYTEQDIVRLCLDFIACWKLSSIFTDKGFMGIFFKLRKNCRDSARARYHAGDTIKSRKDAIVAQMQIHAKDPDKLMKLVAELATIK